jgi:hypothetical protein
MKIFSFIVLLISINAFACPNLAGTYTCEAAGETWEESITQTTQNGATVYQQTGGQAEGTNTFIADGVARPHTVVANEEEIKGTLSAKCSGSMVTVQFLANYSGSPLDFTKKIKSTNGKMEVSDTTKLGGEVIDSTAYDCTRN